MDSFSVVLPLLLMLTAGGQVSDLLDLLPTQSYWQAKHVVVSQAGMERELVSGEAKDVSALIEQLGSPDSTVRDAATAKLVEAGEAAEAGLRAAEKSPDPNVATSATAILQQIAEKDVPVNVRRLMAIRTLGELKDAKALPMLKPLLDSKRRFEADYAQEAIDRINGKTPSTRPAFDPAIRKQDLALLPAENTVIGQISRRGGHASIDSLLITNYADVKERQDAADAITQAVLPVIEKLGNVRLDSASLAGSFSPDDNKNALVVIFHGSYNAKLLLGMFPKENKKDVAGVPAYNEANKDFGPNITVIPVSDDRLILTVADHNNAFDNAFMQKLVIAPDHPATAKELDDLAAKQNGADVNKAAWVRVVLPPGLLQGVDAPPALTQTKDFIFTADYSDKGVELHGVANCTTADDARALMGLIRTGIPALNLEIAAEIQHHPEQAKATEVWQTFLTKLKMETKDTALHASQVFTPELLNLPFSQLVKEMQQETQRQNHPPAMIEPPGN